MDITAYCMKCRAKRKIKDPKSITHSNGKDAVTGKCSTCGTKVFRMGKMPAGQGGSPSGSGGGKKKKGGAIIQKH